MNDYELLKEIIPDDSRFLLEYAEYLPRKNLSLIERWKALSRGEQLIFKEAQELYLKAIFYHKRFDFKNSFLYLNKCFNKLKSIKFYQDLIKEKFIDEEDYKDLLKNIYFYFGDYYLFYEKDLNKAIFYFKKYMEIEDEYSKLYELREYLEENKILKNDFSDLKLFYLNLMNLYKLGKFLDVVKLERRMEDSVLVVSQKIKDEYKKILELAGDAYINLGSFFNAKEAYFKALKLKPDDIVILKKIEEIKDWLNEKDIERISFALDKLRKNRDIRLNKKLNKRTHRFQLPLVFDGENYNFDIYFDSVNKKSSPLISIFLNNKIMAEFYMPEKKQTVYLKFQTKIGKNILEISIKNNIGSIILKEIKIYK